MGGRSRLNRQLEQSRIQEQQRANQLFERSLEPSPEQTRWRNQSAAWDTFLQGKNYSSPPAGTTLGFDLWNPSQTARQRERMTDLEGVGASGLGGDNSIALQLSRERNANQAAEEAGAGYERSIKETDAYFKGQAIPYAGLEANKLANLLGASVQREGMYTQGQIATRPPSLLPMILGGALGGASALLGNPGLFAGGGGGCWIAEAIYGPSDLRTIVLRAWLNTEFKKSPFGRCVMRLYMKFGQRVAKRVTEWPALRCGMKLLFDRASIRSMRWANG
jgi:hypothetical protein